MRLLKQLKDQIDLSSVDYDNRSPLHIAACEGNIEIVEYLLNNNVDCLIKDRWGSTALDEVNKILQKIIPSEEKTPYYEIKNLLETKQVVNTPP